MSFPTFSEALLAACRFAITAFVYLASAVMDAVQYGLVKFPQTTRVAIWIVALYFAYKFSRRLVRMWWSFLVSMLRMVLFNVLILVAAALYIRGPSRFVIHDIPSIYSSLAAFKVSFDQKSNLSMNYWGSESFVTNIRGPSHYTTDRFQ